MCPSNSQNIDTPWHTLPSNDVIKLLNSSINGLTDQEAAKRIENYGSNCLPKAEKKHGLVRFLKHFHNVLIYVLLGCAIVTAMLNHWVDTAVIMTVVLVNAIIGFIQEGKAEHAMSAIRHMLASKASVIRNGERCTIEGEALVPGDVVIIESGDKVPADLRLISAHSLFVQEAILTGESLPVEKHTHITSNNAVLGDRSCMLYSGTIVTSGQAKAIVVKTGATTEIGRISGLLTEVKPLTTPLLVQMDAFAKWLTLLILAIATVLLVYGYYVANYNFTELFIAVVGLSVAAIPEGLPAVLTITLAIGVQIMAKRNVIVRHLPAIETLGSVSVICTDKTGTLTRNEMMVATVTTREHSFTINGNGYAPCGIIQVDQKTVEPTKFSELKELSMVAALCNDASLREHQGTWIVEGDPMEGALLSFSKKVVPDQYLACWTRIDTIPFDARYRFMATLCQNQNQDQEKNTAIYVKGAPERILAMCINQRIGHNETEPLDKDYWKSQADTIASLGQRVLAFAVVFVDPQHAILEHSDVENSLTLIGMTGMIDPPRTEVMAAIEECHMAGIQVKMITGDHVLTAAAIGKNIGLKNTETVLTGADLDNMDDQALRYAALNCDIFARTSPEHKLRLVMALQSHDMIVAMTGDGVNDAPALKRADAGIAMGQKGSETAKEAAELVLVDDNFASIVAAVREGRTVYDNLKKVISWTLPTNAGEALTIIVALFLGMTLPITAIQILWVNLITAVTLGLALAFEPTEKYTMLRHPRPRHEALLTGELVWYVIIVSVLFLLGIFGIYRYAIEQGYSIELARTMSLNTLVVMEIFQLFFIRNIYNTSLNWQAVKGTKVIWLVVVIVIIAQFSITYLPPLQTIFQTESVSLQDGLIIISIGIALFIILEIEKQLRFSFYKLR